MARKEARPAAAEEVRAVAHMTAGDEMSRDQRFCLGGGQSPWLEDLKDTPYRTHAVDAAFAK